MPARNVLLLPQTSLLRALHTVVRDKNASGRDFEIYSRRIIRLLLETGLDLLPFEKREVTTPVGETYHGLEFPVASAGSRWSAPGRAWRRNSGRWSRESGSERS